ncbi:hypothetical protein [Streptococcus orisasini]|uniref:hypothetical protein n=1 Tax=Streptococcus orisasini TaxID=1080071 RepID=UPI00070B3903|nr:hypothetical protein [Streptococcus orisasini]
MYLILDFFTELVINDDTLILSNYRKNITASFRVKKDFRESIENLAFKYVVLTDSKIYSESEQFIISLYKQNKEFFVLVNDVELNYLLFCRSMFERLTLDRNLRFSLIESYKKNKVFIHPSVDYLLDSLKDRKIANLYLYDKQSILRENDILLIDFSLVKEPIMENLNCIALPIVKYNTIGPLLFPGTDIQLMESVSSNPVDVLYLRNIYLELLCHIILCIQTEIYKSTYTNIALPIEAIFILHYPSLNITIESCYRK